jgi:hypothetical protein
MACLVSDTLTEAERECCRHMSDDCGSSAMPDSHSCCKTTVQQLDPYLANSRFDSTFSHPAVIELTAIDFFTPVSLSPSRQSQAPSPPASPPETVSILRI